MRRILRSTIVIALALLGLWLLAAIIPAMAIEEPDYEILEETDRYEIRRYEPFVVAEIEIQGDFKGAGNRAFRPLFRYIAGDNTGDRKIDMTAPVRQTPGSGARIDMTAPVLQRSSTQSRRHRVSFVLPLDYTLETAPEPADPRVELRKIPPRTMAVHRYSGGWSEKRYRRHETGLLAALEADGYTVLGPAEWARYNGPFTPWFLRRNEIMVEVAGP